MDYVRQLGFGVTWQRASSNVIAGLYIPYVPASSDVVLYDRRSRIRVCRCHRQLYAETFRISIVIQDEWTTPTLELSGAAEYLNAPRCR